MVTTMNKPDLDRLESVFKKYSTIKAVYLFGSAASGKMHRESDIDLAVFSDDPSMRTQKLSILTDLAREGFCNVDLVFPGDDDIVAQYEAVRQNKLVYQTAEFDRGYLYSKIVRQYLDFCQYLEVQRERLKQRLLHGKS
jgi:predicted nucleotidyltransferase